MVEMYAWIYWGVFVPFSIIGGWCVGRWIGEWLWERFH